MTDWGHVIYLCEEATMAAERLRDVGASMDRTADAHLSLCLLQALQASETTVSVSYPALAGAIERARKDYVRVIVSVTTDAGLPTP